MCYFQPGIQTQLHTMFIRPSLIILCLITFLRCLILLLLYNYKPPYLVNSYQSVGDTSINHANILVLIKNSFLDLSSINSFLLIKYLSMVENRGLFNSGTLSTAIIWHSEFCYTKQIFFLSTAGWNNRNLFSQNSGDLRTPRSRC